MVIQVDGFSGLGESKATETDFSPKNDGIEYANVTNYGSTPPPNSPLNDDPFQTTEEAVIRQIIPQYDLVPIESFMKSIGDYDKLFSTPIGRFQGLVRDAARRPSDPTPLVEGTTDYEDYPRRLAGREERRNSNILEGKGEPEELLDIAWMEKNER